MSGTKDSERGAPRRKSQDIIKPKPWVVGVGLLVLLLATTLEMFYPLISPDSVAIILASGIAVLLWGIFPYKEGYRLHEKGLWLVGPAALAWLLFSPLADGLKSAPHRRLRTLFASNSGIPGSPYFLELDIGGGNTLRVFDIESLSNDKIVNDLGELKSILENLRGLNMPNLDVEEKTCRFVAATLKQVGIVGEYHTEAMDLVQQSLSLSPPETWEPCSTSFPSGCTPNRFDRWKAYQDSRWEHLVDRAAKGLGNTMLAKRLDRFPFVIATVDSKAGSRVEILFPGNNVIDGNILRIPVVANPHRKSVPGLLEAIVVELGPEKMVTSAKN